METIAPPYRSPEEIQKMALDNLGLVYFTANKILKTPKTEQFFEDLIHEGVISLMNAAKLWIPEKGTFSTYACKAIACNWIRSWRTRQQSVITVKNSYNLRRYNKLVRRSRKDGVLRREEWYRRILKLSKKDFLLVQKVFAGTETKELDVEHSALANHCKSLRDFENQEQCFNLLSKIDENAVSIICKRFGIGFSEMTLEEVGQEYGVTRERIRQIEEKALLELRHLAENDNRTKNEARKHALLKEINKNLQIREHIKKNNKSLTGKTKKRRKHARSGNSNYRLCKG